MRILAIGGMNLVYLSSANASGLDVVPICQEGTNGPEKQGRRHLGSQRYRDPMGRDKINGANGAHTKSSDGSKSDERAPLAPGAHAQDTITLIEPDFGCLDKATLQAAKPPPWAYSQSSGEWYVAYAAPLHETGYRLGSWGEHVENTCEA